MGAAQRITPGTATSNCRISLLLHLQRHSDHHAHPTRPYQVLRDMDNAAIAGRLSGHVCAGNVADGVVCGDGQTRAGLGWR